MTDVVCQACELHQVEVYGRSRLPKHLFIQNGSDGLPNLRNLKRMRETISKEIILIARKELRFPCQPTEAWRVEESTVVPSEVRTVTGWRDRNYTLLITSRITRRRADRLRHRSPELPHYLSFSLLRPDCCCSPASRSASLMMATTRSSGFSFGIEMTFGISNCSSPFGAAPGSPRLQQQAKSLAATLARIPLRRNGKQASLTTRFWYRCDRFARGCPLAS
jgi:hypothetical protein